MVPSFGMVDSVHDNISHIIFFNISIIQYPSGDVSFLSRMPSSLVVISSSRMVLSPCHVEAVLDC